MCCCKSNNSVKAGSEIGRLKIVSRSSESMTWLTDTSGFKAKEKSQGYFVESISPDQRSSQKETDEPSPTVQVAIPL